MDRASFLLSLLCFLLAIPAEPLDFASYCVGFCSTRYQDGIYRHGQCFCGDYYPIHPPGALLPVPHRPKTDFDDPTVYDGKDEMHYAPGGD